MAGQVSNELAPLPEISQPEVKPTPISDFVSALNSPPETTRAEKATEGESDKRAEKEPQDKDLPKKVDKVISDIADGKFSTESAEFLRDVFKKNSDGKTPDEIKDEIKGFTDVVNRALKRDGSKNTVEVTSKEIKGQHHFYMTISGPKIDKEANTKAINEGKETKSAVRLGKVKEWF